MRRSRLSRHAMILAGVLYALPIHAAPEAAKTIGRLPPVETFALSNGLAVAVLRSDVAPVVSVQVWYHAGSKDEPRDRRGTAHMFEHLLFRGTQHVRPELHAQVVNALGGAVSAATDEDATRFIDTLPAEQMDYAIRLEAERMRNLLFRKAAIDGEREVVKDELRQQAGSPFATGLLRCLAVAYLKHPYAWTAAGNAAELDAITADDLRKFYDAYYQPANALLVVVGRVTVAEVKASADRWFGPIAKAEAPPRPAASLAEPPQTGPRHEVVEPGQVGLTLIGWHTPAARDKDSYALQVASVVLGGGDASRLKQRLKLPDAKTKKPLALEAGMDAILREDPGMVVALGAYLDPAQAAAVEAAITDEVGKLAARGPGADELRRAKNQLQSGLTFSLENAQGVGEAIGRAWILTGDPGRFTRDLDELERVSAADVQRVTKQYLAPDRATVVVIPPKAR
jgi:zinc protease